MNMIWFVFIGHQ